jgi:hypothetical protein
MLGSHPLQDMSHLHHGCDEECTSLNHGPEMDALFHSNRLFVKIGLFLFDHVGTGQNGANQIFGTHHFLAKGRQGFHDGILLFEAQFSGTGKDLVDLFGFQIVGSGHIQSDGVGMLFVGKEGMNADLDGSSGGTGFKVNGTFSLSGLFSLIAGSFSFLVGLIGSEKGSSLTNGNADVFATFGLPK